MSYPNNRPTRPGQILSFDEMQDGFVYVGVNDNYGSSCFRLLSKDLIPGHNKSLKMRMGTAWDMESSGYLSDNGLLPYNSGVWNPVNSVRKPTTNKLLDFIGKESRMMSSKLGKQ